MRLGLWLCGLSAIAASGCNPYKNLDGDFYLGPVDATNFSAPYLGAGFMPTQSVGTITPSVAGTLGGGAVAYYPFPTGADPLTIDQAGGGTTALVYIFDGDDSADSSKCKPPSANYSYDVRRDFVRFDRQGNIFEDQSPAPPLPDDPAYVPVYAEIKATSNGEHCQSVHSAEGLVSNHLVSVALGDKPSDSTEHAVGTADGQYLAIAMVDPRAVVLLPDGTLDSNGFGAARYGFYNHLLAGYIEGGYIPTAPASKPDPNGGDPTMIIQAKTATLYAPNTTLDDKGNPVGCDTAAPTDPAAPCIGLGFDLIDGVDSASGARGDSGYSPICHIITFTPADPANPPLDPADVDPQSLDMDSGTYVYCLQVAQ